MPRQTCSGSSSSNTNDMHAFDKTTAILTKGVLLWRCERCFAVWMCITLLYGEQCIQHWLCR